MDIISTTALPKKVRSVESLEKMYMGKLMKDLRGRVNVEDAFEILRKEMEARLHIEAPKRDGGYYEVRVIEEEAQGPPL